MKLLWYGETPFIETGAGQVAKHLLPIFQELFEEIHLIAINQQWEQKDLPAGLTVTRASPEDLWAGEQARKYIRACDYDLLFLTADLNRISDLMEEIRVAQDHRIPIIIYAAMDCHIFTRQFWEVLTLATVPIVFSAWCVRHAELMLPELKGKILAINHGCEPDVFYPLSEEERREARKEIFHIGDETFLVLNVNRNQVRKDLVRSMAAFWLFHQEYPASLLYMHCKQSDLGGCLPAQAAFLGIPIEAKPPVVMFSPEGLHELAGVPRSDLNKIYNAADCFVTSSTGEGWGLTTTEAMAAGTPIVAPKNTVFPEILGDTLTGGTKYEEAERGLLVESGGPDLWTIFYGVSDTARELVSTTGLAAALKNIYEYRDQAYSRVFAARVWAESHSWEQIAQQWRTVLSGVCADIGTPV